MFETTKEIGKGVKESFTNFCTDTKEYFEEHPWVFGTLIQGSFTLLLTGMLIGCNSAEKEISKAYKNNSFKTLVNGKKFKKDMTFDEGMKYLDFCNTKGNKYKDWMKYLKEKGFID
jgi:hypothetical protein